MVKNEQNNKHMKNLSHFWTWVIKILVIAGSYGYIYYQLFYEKNSFEQLRLYHFNWTKAGLLALVLVLMFANWSLESIKWKILVKPLEKINFWHSFKGVVIGLTTSIFTPNRTGEYFGRIWVLSQRRVQGIFATITGSIAQLSVTLTAGIISLIYFIPASSGKLRLLANNKSLILSISIGLAIILLAFLFSLPFLSGKLKRFKKLHFFFDFLKQYTFYDFSKVLTLSTLRYFIFILQFFLILFIFDISLDISKVFLSLGLIYFAMAFIPSFTIAEIGIRGSLAITIFSIFVPDTTGIFLAISLLWIINIALPAIVGSFFLFKLKIKLNDR